MIDQLNDHLVIVIAIEHYNPLGQLRTLGENGISPIFIGLKYKVRMASASKYPQKVHHVDTEDEAFEVMMKNYGNVAEKTGKKPILLFSDDKTVGFYDERYDELKDKFILFNAGESGRITKYMDKLEILQCANRHGVPTLPARVLELGGGIPKDLEYPVITKAISPNSGAWKGDVNICYSEEELKEAFTKIQSPLVLVQKYIDKKTEMTLEGFSVNKGKEMFVGTQCFYQYPIKGYYSPFHTNQPFKDKELHERLTAMLTEIGFEGVFEIEFLIDKDDNKYFSEINFRNSTWSYSSTVAGNPLPYLWCKAMLEGHAPEPNDFEPFTSMVEPIDFGKRVDEGRCSLGEWLKDFKEAKCTYYYNSEDLEPYRIVCENWDKLK